MTEVYDRESQLQNRLNTFIEQDFGLPRADYYDRLNLEGFLRMKSVLSDINNIFTMKVTLAFSELVSNHLALNEAAKQEIISQILETKPNANGYDIEVSEPVKIIAEVKCNVPVNGGKVYGSAQKDGIAKDINSLMHGKSKSSIDPAGYLKFMVFLDIPEIRDATSHFVKNMRGEKERISFLDSNSKAEDTSRVYVAYVGF